MSILCQISLDIAFYRLDRLQLSRTFTTEFKLQMVQLAASVA